MSGPLFRDCGVSTLFPVGWDGTSKSQRVGHSNSDTVSGTHPPAAWVVVVGMGRGMGRWGGGPPHSRCAGYSQPTRRPVIAVFAHASCSYQFHHDVVVVHWTLQFPSNPLRNLPAFALPLPRVQLGSGYFILCYCSPSAGWSILLTDAP